MSYLCCVCLLAHSVAQSILCCVFALFSVVYVASFSGLSIFDCPFSILLRLFTDTPIVYIPSILFELIVHT